jgi:DNA repair exonuclease SbcCD ATPase subunit
LERGKRMKPLRIRIKNIGPFADETIDLDSIPGDLVAISGLNGEGKTMLMESIFAGMYRNFPSRDAGIYRYCTNRHAAIEFAFEVGGKIYISFINMDSKTRKMEAILSHDKLPLNDGLSGTFDDAISKILGSEGQALASSFGSQEKKGNFLQLEKAKRKELFISMIGAAMLQSISIDAKLSGESLELERSNLDGQLKILKETAEKTIPNSSGIQVYISSNTDELNRLQVVIDELAKKIILSGSKIEKLPSLREEKTSAENDLVALKEILETGNSSLNTQKALLECLPFYRDQLKCSTDNATSAREQIITLREKCSQLPMLTEKKKISSGKLKTAGDAREEIVKTIRFLTLISETLPSLKEKNTELIQLRQQETENSMKLRQLNTEFFAITREEQERAKTLFILSTKWHEAKKEESRVQGLYDSAKKGADLIKEAYCQGEGNYSQCKFLTTSVEAASKMDEYSTAIDNARIVVLGIQQEIDAVPKVDTIKKESITSEINLQNSKAAELRNRIPQLEEAVKNLADAEASENKLVLLKESLITKNQEVDAATDDLLNCAGLIKEIELHQKSIKELSDTLTVTESIIETFNEKIKSASECEIRITQLNADIATCQVDIVAKGYRISQIIKEISSLEEMEHQHAIDSNLLKELRDVRKPELVKMIREGEANLIKAQEEAAAIIGAQTKLAVIETKLNDIIYRMKCYALVSKAFGPMEIQSFEIDCAGPEVSRIANELLFNCFGPRFSIKFVTQEAKADGKGYKDEFDISVFDQKFDRWVSVDDLSGGQKVIISESVALAIALYNREKNGVAWETLFRDEVAGALDDRYVPQYIAMLRSAREMGHFKKVYFISHQGRMKEMADSRIVVSEGKLSIEA